MIQYFWRRRGGGSGNYVNWKTRALSDIRRFSAPYINWDRHLLSEIKIFSAHYVNWDSGVLSDQNKLLVQLNFNADITDRSIYANPSYFNSSTTFLIQTTEKKFGAGSLYLRQAFGSSTNGLFLDGSRADLLTIGAGDFSIQLWCRWINYSASASLWSPCFVSVQNSFDFGLSNGLLRLDYSLSGGGSGSVSTAFTPTLNQWYHIAITRQTGEVKFWIDGIVSVGGTVSNFEPGNNTCRIGVSRSLIDTFEGYFDELEITRGYKPILLPSGGY